jgi:hypothetical protein
MTKRQRTAVVHELTREQRQRDVEELEALGRDIEQLILAAERQDAQPIMIH